MDNRIPAGEEIFITGGAGYLGKAIVEHYYDTNPIIVYSRDEAKHHILRQKYPEVSCVIGDIRDIDRFKDAARNARWGIFAASMKQIEAVDSNVEEAIKTIINGAINSRLVARGPDVQKGSEMKAACFISTDKSRAATTLYGSMKFVAGESFIVNSKGGNGAGPWRQFCKARLSTVIYGNVTNSTGSIVPMIWDAIKNNRELTLYHPDMTRFMITKEEAVDIIELALQCDGVNVIPKLKSFRVIDLFNLYKEEFGLQYTVGEPRISEKVHEIMIAEEEIPRVSDFNTNAYLMHYRDISPFPPIMPGNTYSSKDNLVTQDELFNILAKHQFYGKK